MRTSLIEIQKIESFLLRKIEREESLLLEAKMILDTRLRCNVDLQKKISQLINIFGRRDLKSEIERTERQLFNDDSHEGFRQEIEQIFQNH